MYSEKVDETLVVERDTEYPEVIYRRYYPRILIQDAEYQTKRSRWNIIESGSMEQY